jgi:RNA polymerase sigma factor (sigma-70 family)
MRKNMPWGHLFYCRDIVFRLLFYFGGGMSWDESREKALAVLLSEFSLFINAHIRKFRVANFGVDIEDVAQDVKIKLWKILRDEKKISNYPSYIKKVVDSSVIDHLRKCKRDENIFVHEKAKTISERAQSYAADPISAMSDPRDALGRAIDRLIESRRAVVQLYMMNFSIAEISEHFRWSQHKTRNLLYRGLADIRRFLKGKD